MRTLIITVTILITAFGLQSCLKCKGDDVNQGIIVSSYNGRCVANPEGIVLNSLSDVDSVYYGNRDWCPIDSSFDFNSYTLLAIETYGSCNMKTIKNVERNDQLQKYLYHVQVEDCGCFNKRLDTDHNAVVVPKLPVGYTVEFVVTGQK